MEERKNFENEEPTEIEIQDFSEAQEMQEMQERVNRIMDNNIGDNIIDNVMLLAQEYLEHHTISPQECYYYADSIESYHQSVREIEQIRTAVLELIKYTFIGVEDIAEIMSSNISGVLPRLVYEVRYCYINVLSHVLEQYRE